MAIKIARLIRNIKDFFNPIDDYMAVTNKYGTKDLTILIPVLNKEETLEENIKRLRKVAKNSEILIMYDISRAEFEKNARKEAARLGRKYKTRTIFRLNQRGFGSALRMGFEHAKRKLVLITMGDLCDDPNTIPKMISKINEGYSGVSGSRYMKGGGIEGNTPKQWISSTVSLLINIFSTLKCRDITNAFKMYRKEVLNNVKTESNSFDISAELTLKAAAAGYQIGQVPTVWKNRSIGQSNFNVLKEARRYFEMFIYAAVKMPSLLTKFIAAMLALGIIYAIFEILLFIKSMI